MANSLGILKLWIVCLIWVTIVPMVSLGVDFSGGTGEPNDPYLIETSDQLLSIGFDPNLLDKHFALLADIDLDPNLPGGQILDQAIIAPDTNSQRDFQGIAFTGSFDGRGMCIHHLSIDSNEGDYLGLFGMLGEGARICDVNFAEASIGGRSVAGCVAGLNAGSIVNCHAVNVNVHVWGGAGGLLGTNEGLVDQCSATGYVSSSNPSCQYGAFGGLVGSNNGALFGSHACVEVSVFEWMYDLGGLVGFNWNVIQDCYATGDIMGGERHMGGLVGYNLSGHITRSYASGTVRGVDRSWNLGGLIGGNSQGTVSLCKATGKVIGGQGSRCIGGLIGSNRGTLTNAYATGYIISGEQSFEVGSLVGLNQGPLANCYALGSVSCGDNSQRIGALVGLHYLSQSNPITACFWDVQTGDQNESPAGIGLDTTQFHDIQTFLEAGWDWVNESSNGTADLWTIPKDANYPELVMFTETYQRPELLGSGTQDDPYQILTPEDLGAINHYDPTACYRLEADLDLSDIQWSSACISSFHGKFDGGDHVISGLTIQGGGALGLFGTLASEAEVSNLIMQDTSVIGSGNYLAMLIADNQGGHIHDCAISGMVTGADQAGYVGGLVGMQRSGKVENCQVSCEVSGGQKCRYMGGLVGYQMQGMLTQCHTSGQVTADEESSYVGGLVGCNKGTLQACFSCSVVEVTDNGSYVGGLIGNNATGTIMRSFACGDVTGGFASKYVGGLVGQNGYYDQYASGGGQTQPGIVSECYATGHVSVGPSGYCVGGLVGWHMDGSVHHSYAMGSVIYGKSSKYIGGFLGAYSTGATYDGYFLSPYDSGSPDNGMGVPLRLSQLSRQTSFKGWDFEEVWTLDNGLDAPHFQWE